jgi:hypothetical protein
MVSKTSYRDGGVAALALALMLVGWPAAASGGYATESLGRLAQVLAERGWQVSPDTDGSLLLRAAGSGNQGNVVEPPGLHPGQARAEIAAPPPPPNAWLADLAGRLEAGGWAVAWDADGGLRFHRPSDTGPALDPVETRPTIAAQPATAVTTHHWLEGLGAQLQQRGWDVQREEDGSLRLPLRSTPAVVTPEPVATPGPTLADLLAERGWSMQWDASGNLLLTALGRLRGPGGLTRGRGVEHDDLGRPSGSSICDGLAEVSGPLRTPRPHGLPQDA